MNEDIVEGQAIPWVVTNVEPKEDYTLIITFITGEKKIFDMKPLLDKKNFEQLKDITLFMKAYVDGTSVSWNDSIDIAPEYLYENGSLI
jgi:hypothetical protein